MSELKRWLLRTLVILIVLGGLGFLVAAIGIIPIKASSGHAEITKWFLNFSQHRSVSLHSHGIKVPPGLDDPGMIMRGAGHYETACRGCHGSPSLKRPVIAAEMTPQPPWLDDTLLSYSTPELFYIVKHGIKFTAMPAWPARQRDDEIWAMVAFLLVFPESAERYEELVFGSEATDESDGGIQLSREEDVPREVRDSCARCHGLDGNGRHPGAFPRLAGQKETYLYNSLKAYAEGVRHSGIMQPVAEGLSDETMRNLARYYSSQRARAREETPEEQAVELGKRIALEGIASKKIPSCTDCHGPLHAPDVADAYPHLAGQEKWYLEAQLKLFADGKRGGSEWSKLMEKIAPKLGEEERKAVAAWYASLDPVHE